MIVCKKILCRLPDTFAELIKKKRFFMKICLFRGEILSILQAD